MKLNLITVGCLLASSAATSGTKQRILQASTLASKSSSTTPSPSPALEVHTPPPRLNEAVSSDRNFIPSPQQVKAAEKAAEKEKKTAEEAESKAKEESESTNSALIAQENAMMELIKKAEEESLSRPAKKHKGPVHEKPEDHVGDDALLWMPLPDGHPNAKDYNTEIGKAREQSSQFRLAAKELSQQPRPLTDDSSAADASVSAVSPAFRSSLEAEVEKVVKKELGLQPKNNSNATSLVQVQGADTFCWKDDYYNAVVGTIPDVCQPGRVMHGGLCYWPCQSGYGAALHLCWEDCKSGYTDYGMTCTDWGAQYWKPCCCTIFGCCGCSSGYTDEGCSCRKYAHTYAKDSYNRGVGLIPNGCSGGKVNYQGLCYPACDYGYEGVLNRCWQTCPSDNPVNCGAGCANTDSACFNTVFSQVLGPIEIAFNVGMNVFTAGGWALAGTAAKAAIKTGAKTFVKAGAKAAAKGYTRAQVKQGIKDAGKNLAKEAIEKATDYAMKTAGQYDHGSNLVGEEYELPDADLTLLCELDPTGISGTVMAYAKPGCTHPQPPPPPPVPEICKYTGGCESRWMGASDGCDCNSDGSVCPDGDCFSKPCKYHSGCSSSYMGTDDGCDCESNGSRCPDKDCV